MRQTITRSEQVVGYRGPNAWTPPKSAAAARAFKARVTAKAHHVQTLLAANPATLSWKERNEIEWASPKMIAKQVAETGNALMPRREALTRAIAFRSWGRPVPRTNVVAGRRTRAIRSWTPLGGASLTSAGKAQVVRHGL